jgi:hypothetical protein
MRAAGFLGRFHRCESGQAIFVVVLFFFLLAGLLFLILNGGEELNRKVQMQSTADIVAHSGATWYARGLNIICMTNTTETQLLSLIVLLDTLETVVPPAQECIDDLVQNIGRSKAGRDIPIDQRLASWLVVGNAESEQQIIRQFADVVKAVNWPDYLTYDSGVMWECIKLMDGFALVMSRETPRVVQREAIDIARKNKAEVGFLLPLWPELPVQRGQFSDFREPMVNSRMPPPNTRQLIGGFANLMGYRGYNGQAMGPWNYWREPFTATRPMGLFDISRFSVPFLIVSEMKLEMLFGGTDDQWTARQWEMDYDKAKGVPREDIRRCWWEVSTFDARYGNNEEREPFPLPASGGWGASYTPSRPTPSTRTYGDMRYPDLSMYKRASQSYEGADPREAVWYRCERRRTAHYPQIGIFAPHPPIHPDGSPWPYTDAEMKTYWHVTLWRFNGLEKHTDETLHRRYMPSSGVAPFAPTMLDSATGALTAANLRSHFTFNGFAYRTGAVKNWPTRFVNPNPVDDVVCYAQSRVYNRYSWDLFTQHWKVKLMRQDRWKELLEEIDKPFPSQGGTVAAVLTPERLKPVRQNLEGYDEQFMLEVTH